MTECYTPHANRIWVFHQSTLYTVLLQRKFLFEIKLAINAKRKLLANKLVPLLAALHCAIKKKNASHSFVNYLRIYLYVFSPYLYSHNKFSISNLTAGSKLKTKNYFVNL